MAEMSEWVATIGVGRNADPLVLFPPTHEASGRLEKRRLGQAGAYCRESLKKGIV